MQGAGKRYLIEHSAGSGKSNSISWLAHQLSVLHNAATSAFSTPSSSSPTAACSIAAPANRAQFQQTLGVVENIDTTSHKLQEALEDGKTIIVTTLQKFPHIVEDHRTMPGKRFAVIIDEAHSSQSGESTRSMKFVLTLGTLDDTDIEENEDGDDLEDRIADEMKKRGPLKNVSFFAFTATPKPKTLELFGTKRADGPFEPLASIPCARPSKNTLSWMCLRTIPPTRPIGACSRKIASDPHYDRSKAALLLKSFVDHHEQTIAKKPPSCSSISPGRCAHLIDARARAMIVTRSRLQAIRYKQAVDSYLKEHGYAV